MDTFVSVWKNSFNYAGRARRKEYWMFTLFNILAMVVLAVLGGLLGGSESMLASVPLGLYALASLFPSLAVGVRRLHDTGRSAWWLLINLVPFIGGIWFFVLTVLDSKPESNLWGDSPKYSGVAVV
jgi:uncharacterized membrane protein YhaH (DUF805 family)